MYIPYWDYFLSLEKDLVRCTDFVEFENSNFSTYSINFAKIIMATSAEIDTICKELCFLICNNRKARNIKKYAEIITQKYPKIVEMDVSLQSYKITRRPFENWTKDNSPNWWIKYNKIKHDRTASYREASLINAIDSMAALLIIILYYNFSVNKKEIEIDAFSAPRLFDINDNSGSEVSNGGIFWEYKIRTET